MRSSRVGFFHRAVVSPANTGVADLSAFAPPLRPTNSLPPPQLLLVLHKYDCVAMFISGHAHKDGYHRDHRGIHHVVLPAALETPADKVLCFVLYVFVRRVR